MAALGVAVWPMVEFEADDALASAARSRPVTLVSTASSSARRTRIWRSASRHTRRADGSAEARHPRRGGHRGEVRRAAGSHPRLPRAGRRLVGRLPRSAGLGPKTAAGVLRQCGSLEGHSRRAIGARAGVVLFFLHSWPGSDATCRSSNRSTRSNGTAPVRNLRRSSRGLTERRPQRPHPPLVPTHHRDPRRRSLTVKTSCGDVAARSMCLGGNRSPIGVRFWP